MISWGGVGTNYMKGCNDDRFARVLDVFGIDSHALLGKGGESWVFALDDARIARINRPNTSRAQVDSRTALLAELGYSIEKVPFGVPVILDTIEIKGHIITIERRLPGRPLIQLLAESAGEARAVLIRAYLEAAAQIGDLVVRRPWYGDLLHTDTIRTSSYSAYLEKRAAQSLKTAGPKFKNVNPAQLAAALPEPAQKTLVHLDAYPGNMLAAGREITAVLDFGASCIIGDRLLDPLTAAVYLTPSITPTATEEDSTVAREWLVARGLASHYSAVQNWIAAYWSFAADDVSLSDWCRKILVD